MDVQPRPYPEYKVQWSGVTREYRVTIWEQPEMPGVDPSQIAWGEITFDLVGVQDVQIAGWDPSHNPRAENLRRAEGDS